MNNTNILTPWNAADKLAWFNEQTIKRSYKNEVVSKIDDLKKDFKVEEYGSLKINPERYPLYLIKSKNIDPKKKTILITGGVHGYETSGVYGALAFLKDEAKKFTDIFNIICVPCVSPWAYETINRWNALAIDPNRSFIPNSPAEECRLFLTAIHSLNIKIYAHFDLHETTDTDNSVFRPALEKRDGIIQEVWDIPDGFYLVGDTENPQKEFQKAVIDSVRRITHIAPADNEGMIIGVPVEQEGVINYELKKLSLCGGCMDPEFSTTTEVYPDSAKVTTENCVKAHVAAVLGGTEFLLSIL
ncbi:MAG: M14 family metallocarboxypeptidase [Bacteriovorax sp.]|nr:M14 family metallocarboxypeptidase [Bacteriovorax sp.]